MTSETLLTARFPKLFRGSEIGRELAGPNFFTPVQRIDAQIVGWHALEPGIRSTPPYICAGTMW